MSGGGRERNEEANAKTQSRKGARETRSTCRVSDLRAGGVHAAGVAISLVRKENNKKPLPVDLWWSVVDAALDEVKRKKAE